MDRMALRCSSWQRRIRPCHSFLPFLYETATIQQNSFTTQSRLRNEDSQDIPWENGELEQRTSRVRVADRRRSARPPRRPSSKPASAYVPFIRSTGEKDGRDGYGKKTSTITPSESEAFARLRKLAKSSDAQPTVLDGVSGRAAPSSQETSSAPQERSTNTPIEPISHLVPASSPDRRIRADLALVREQLSAAETDSELWDILLGQVLSRVTALRLDPVTGDRQAAAIKLCRPRSGRRTKVSGDELEVLRTTLPQHLHFAAQLLRDRFPASAYTLAVLPFLKKLGPSAFALGASTPLFNAHMTALYERHHDLAAVAATLEDMDRNVYAFDNATDELLDRIATAAGAARSRGAPGPGVRAIWQTTRSRQWLQQLWRWRQTIMARRQEAVLRELHRREAAQHARGESVEG